MDTPAAEPSSYGTFDTLCGLVAGSAVIMLAVGACLLLGALVTYANVDQPGTTDIAKLESKALAASLVSYGVTCITSGIPLLIFSYGGWIFLDLARNNRLQVQKTDEVLKHLAEINPKYEERLRREQEAAQRRAEAEQEAAQRRAEAEQEATRRKAEKERQEALARWTAGANNSIVSGWPKRNARSHWRQRQPGNRKTSVNSESGKPEATHSASSTKSSPRLGKRTGSATLPG